MAAAIKKKLGVEAQLIKGDRGVFDVVVDGTRVYCKHETGRFPDDDEVLAALAER